MIGIRVDGNATLGTGHIMRCLSIASELSAAGASPVFFCAEHSERIAEAGYECVALGGKYNDLSQEDLSPILHEHSIKTLLVDSYYTDAAYFERLLGINRAVIFDMGNSGIACELLVDYNINYEDFNFPHAKKTLLGPLYAPLRAEFGGKHSRSFMQARSVLFTAGGSDPAGITVRAIEAFAAQPWFNSIEFRVVVGGMNASAAKIKAKASLFPNIIIYENVSNMAELMRGSDLALCAGGTTLYEVCACALPCVAFSIADNQDDMIAGMERAGVMLSAGIYRFGAKECLSRMSREAERLLGDAALRERLSSAARSLVDGHGAARIAREILSIE